MTTSPITSISDELLADLEAAAKDATPGPWGWDGPVWNYDPEEEAPWLVQEGGALTVITGELTCSEENAEFVALANPATILALLAERAELKRDAERLEWIVDQVAMVHTYPGRDGASYCVYWPDSESEQAHTHATPREAIDAAMQEAKP